MGLHANMFSKRKKYDDSMMCPELSELVADGSEGNSHGIAKGIPKSPEYEMFAPDAPALRDGLTIQPTLSYNSQDIYYLTGAHVFHDGTHVFTVNETGRELLCMANGQTTIDDMAEMLGMEEHASEVGLFFVALGKSGYLKNRIEINLYSIAH